MADRKCPVFSVTVCPHIQDADRLAAENAALQNKVEELCKENCLFRGIMADDSERQILLKRVKELEAREQPQFILDQCNEIQRLAADNSALQTRVSGLEDRIDLMIDEFMRIKSCPGVNSEIVGLCERAVLETMQHVPVIMQRDTLIKEKAFLHHANMEFQKRVKELEAEKGTGRWVSNEAIKEMWNKIDWLPRLSASHLDAIYAAGFGKEKKP